MINFQKIYNLIPFGTEITNIHHVGFIIPSSMKNIDLKSLCDKFCVIDILKSEVGYKKFNNMIVELIKPIDEKSILFQSSKKINDVTFDHFGYSSSELSLKEIKHIKISKFYTCLFETEVEFILSNNQKIEIVYDNL
jgi:hypothetical protein